MPFDPRHVRADFPALGQRISGHPLAYLDNAATTQMPEPVLAAMARFVHENRANVHRGVHALSERATAAYEGARATVHRFLNARAPGEIVFVRGTTEAINLVAHSFVRPRLGAGDEILVTELEHHSNILPWQILCAERGARLRVVPMTGDGQLALDRAAELLGPRTRLLAVAHVANATGAINPVAELVRLAHERDVPVLVDGAQAVAHLPVDVQALGCDFYAFSGHKVFGPTGIGALYARAELLARMAPYQAGGEMVVSVSFDKATYAEPPHRFEAGTPALEGAIGLAAALDYLGGLDREAVAAHERSLLEHATEQLAAVPEVRILGRASTARAPQAPSSTSAHAPILAFVLAGVHPHDLGTVLDRHGVAIRTGHHCAQPLHERLGVPATARASFAFYNTVEEADALARAVIIARDMLGPGVDRGRAVKA